MNEKRKVDRRDLSYYLQIKDKNTKQVIGCLSDISAGGFKLDSPQNIQPGRDFHMFIELTPDLSSQTSIDFIARSKWVIPDRFEFNTFNVGFEIINISPNDMAIFQRMFERYGKESASRQKRDDYLWK
ncbi:MAG: PilZ domain-containing protein [Anaerolineales bacterium]|nr:PilZ domain-containing protein [Anaerolineales bacterium]MCL4259142.1 PilZ domain-containing protein [Anaerolineales bacterium]